jgi:hypothetical protein
MAPHLTDSLSVAVRVWAVRDQAKLTRTERRRAARRLKREANKTSERMGRATAARPSRLPSVWVVFDCESRIDETQALTFGVCRIYEDGRLIVEIIFFADDLPERDPEGFARLQRYADGHLSDALTEFGVTRKPLSLMPCSRFLDEVLYPIAYEGHAVVVGLNLAFDLARIARRAGITKDNGGFSLVFWENPWLPRVQVRIDDNKRARIRFTRREGYEGESRYDASFAGHFLDLRMLAYAVTDKGYSLATACKEFGTEHEKLDHQPTGQVDAEEIDYCRRDVLVTWELAVKLCERFAQHPIDALPTKVRSGASISKGYLRRAKVVPILARHPAFNRRALGQSMGGYYGGRSEDPLRRTVVPVVYTDFTSMYTTVSSLLEIRRFLIAQKLTIEDATAEVQAFLDHVSIDDLFKPETWRELVGFVEIIPDGRDILPTRALYDPRGAYQIGVNYFESDRALWYTLAEAVADKLLSGKVPTILRAWRLVPHGVADGLQPVLFNSEVPVDPTTDDLFVRAVEARNRLPNKKSATGTALKLIPNAAYGITVEMNPERLGEGETAEVEVYGTHTFRTRVARPEEPGEYCFPPLGATITGAARLMLGLLERLVTDAGGYYAFTDTDSMAIVASKEGGLVPCLGGPDRMPDGRAAIRALSWAEVEVIRQRFASLNPYAHDAVPGSILKIEDVNFDADSKQRQLYTFAISAKRYALFTLDVDGEPVIVDAKAHGLGHLLPPERREVTTDGNDDEEKLKPWMRELWLMIVREALGLPVTEPAWFDQPAMSRITVSKPATLKLFDAYNKDKPYADRIKPTNFLIAPHVARFGHPVGVDRSHFALIAPFTSNADTWLDLEYSERYSGKRYRISTSIPMDTEDTVRVQTYRDVFHEYRTHPEAKFNGPDGKPCGRNTVGLLSRRHVRLGELHFVGKESNELEAREYGQTADLDEVQTEYVDPSERHRARAAEVEALIEAQGVAGAASMLGVSERTLRRWRAEGSATD